MLQSQSLIDYICELSDLSEADIEFDTALFSSSLLDSFHMVELVSFIEEEFEIKFRALDLNMSNIDSISAILTYVQSRKS